jgi:hypothetical protein
MSFRIDSLLERGEAHAAIGVQKALRLTSLAEIGFDESFDGGDDLVVGDRRTEQTAEAGVLRARTAKCDLIKLFAFLIDAEDADVTDVMVTAGIDAARDLDL